MNQIVTFLLALFHVGCCGASSSLFGDAESLFTKYRGEGYYPQDAPLHVSLGRRDRPDFGGAQETALRQLLQSDTVENELLDEPILQKRNLHIETPPKAEYIALQIPPTLEVIPNDPNFPQQWGFHRTGAPAAWKLLQGEPSSSLSKEKITVCVTDSGIDPEHPDLKANIHPLVGYDALSRGKSEPYDELGHGTHISGVISAVGNNSLDVAGLIWDNRVQILACKFLNGQGFGAVSHAITCIDYCLGMGADIITNSWSGATENIAIKEAIQVAESRGTLFVSAAGNDGVNISQKTTYPAAYSNEVSNIIVVASTNSEDHLSTFSNYGSERVDIAAPGEDILSTAPGNGTAVFSGTSMAAPLVSGAAALLLTLSDSTNNSRILRGKPHCIKELLMSTVDAIPGLNGKVGAGGVLRIDQAAKKLLQDPDFECKP